MYIISKLERQNVKVTEIPKWGSYLRKTWENRFAASMEPSGKGRDLGEPFFVAFIQLWDEAVFYRRTGRSSL